MSALDDRSTAAIDLIGHTGCTSFQIRFSPEDEHPVVWTAIASYRRPSGETHETAAGMTPDLAVRRLTELLIDGGTCVHCGRMTSIAWTKEEEVVASIVEGGCWYRWVDPTFDQTTGRSTPGRFRRDCDGT